MIFGVQLLMYLSVVFCLVKTGLFVADIFKQRKCQLLLNDPALSDEMQSCREYIYRVGQKSPSNRQT